MINPFLHIAPSKIHGKGVFTNAPIEANTLIEVSPVLVLTAKETACIDKTSLYDYYFIWGEAQKESALGLGYISIYNHAENPNCIFECDFENNTISIITRTPIEAGDELTINYNNEIGKGKKLWFEK